MKALEFVDLKAQYAAYKGEIDAAIGSVLESTRFIGGPEIEALESELASYCGAKHAIGCSSGTDALFLVLPAMGLAPGDEVIVPDFTFFATAEVVSLASGTPVFVDVDPVTYNIDPDRVRESIGPKTRGIIAVSLYGQCADYDLLGSIAQEHGLWLMEDGAQSFGASYKGRKSCSLTPLATTSFFPAKPLGCYGDGGAIFVDDDELAQRLRMLRNHGQDKRYSHALVGTNSRLDAIQAAILRVKLKHLDEELEARNRIASLYTAKLSEFFRTPEVLGHNRSVWAQYTIRLKDRDRVRSQLQDQGVPTAVHYPKLLSQQRAYADLERSQRSSPIAEKASTEVMSLPMHPFMTEDQVDKVCNALIEALAV